MNRIQFNAILSALSSAGGHFEKACFFAVPNPFVLIVQLFLTILEPLDYTCLHILRLVYKVNVAPFLYKFTCSRTVLSWTMLHHMLLRVS